VLRGALGRGLALSPIVGVWGVTPGKFLKIVKVPSSVALLDIQNIVRYQL